MRLLFCGDVVGRAGRRVVREHLRRLRERLALDFVVVNGENAAHGFGLTAPICRELYAAGADAITTGNHVWDKPEILDAIASDARLLRPANFPAGAPGRGAGVFPAPGGRRVLVANVIGRLFMDAADDPFGCVECILAEQGLGSGAHAAIVDFHGEATSEKMAMGHFLDGRASLVVGTHSHVPTADARVLAGGTAYQTDVGMCGDYDSVIGMDKWISLDRFLGRVPAGRLEPAAGEATLSALFVETDDATGLAVRAAPVRLGGCLAPEMPG
ncbi:MAG: YmdB family metallophosphoesterase [Proteobacteria bacterium]|nr:YmdB family metallophosphoesterase [Pseudomonadota bacterium]